MDSFALIHIPVNAKVIIQTAWANDHLVCLYCAFMATLPLTLNYPDIAVWFVRNIQHMHRNIHALDWRVILPVLSVKIRFTLKHPVVGFFWTKPEFSQLPRCCLCENILGTQSRSWGQGLKKQQQNLSVTVCVTVCSGLDDEDTHRPVFLNTCGK